MKRGCTCYEEFFHFKKNCCNINCFVNLCKINRIPLSPFSQKAFIITFLFLSTITVAQTREISGSILASESVEGIHVINRTSYRYSTTDTNGVFKIQAKLSDTLYFSSVQYIPKIIIVSSKMIKNNSIIVQLEDSVTALNEVTIGNILTGDLNSDINNSNSERPLNFYDLGIPGYTGLRKTQIENRLDEADAGRFIYWGIPTPQFNLWKILNRFTGRTKRLIRDVKTEKTRTILTHIKEVVGPELFKYYDLPENLKSEFYYSCTDDENFHIRCTNRSDVEILQFLEEKLIEFKINISSEN